MALLLPPVSAGTTPGPETVCPPRDRSCRHGEKWLWSVQGSIGPIRGSSSAPDPAVGSPFCGGPDVVAGGGVWVVWWYWVTPGPAPGPPPVPEGHSASVHLLTDIAGQVIGWAATLSLAHPLHPPRTQAPGVASAYRTGPRPGQPLLLVISPPQPPRPPHGTEQRGRRLKALCSFLFFLLPPPPFPTPQHLNTEFTNTRRICPPPLSWVDSVVLILQSGTQHRAHCPPCMAPTHAEPRAKWTPGALCSRCKEFHSDDDRASPSGGPACSRV